MRTSACVCCIFIFVSHGNNNTLFCCCFYNAQVKTLLHTLSSRFCYIQFYTDFQFVCLTHSLSFKQRTVVRKLVSDVLKSYLSADTDDDIDNTRVVQYLANILLNSPSNIDARHRHCVYRYLCVDSTQVPYFVTSP